MAISKVTRNYQITIPSELRKLLKIEIGSMVDFAVEKGHVILRPKTLVESEQAWFWTKEWQKAERQADDDKRTGLTRKFGSVAEMRAHYARKKKA